MDEQMDEGIDGQMAGREERLMRHNNRCLMGGWTDG